jgi:hypothetical protein
MQSGFDARDRGAARADSRSSSVSATVHAMRRVSARLVSASGGGAVLAVLAIAFATRSVNAELENQVFSSKTHRLRLVVPRGWRATDQPSYPGLLLWMLRSQPEGQMVLTAEPFTRAMYCSWPLECRTSADPLQAKLACAVRSKLGAQRLRVGPTQAGPKENESVGIPSVWFEIDDTKRYLRQAVAIGEDRVVSLVLSAPSAETRSAHVRAFEQALRTLRPLTDDELGIPAQAPEAVVMQLVTDAAVTDGGVAPTDASATGATTFESAPVSKVAPVGPCAKP